MHQIQIIINVTYNQIEFHQPINKNNVLAIVHRHLQFLRIQENLQEARNPDKQKQMDKMEMMPEQKQRIM